MPEGGRRVESNGITVLIPPDLPRGKAAYVGIPPGQDLAGSLRAWFDGDWSGWRKSYRVLDGGQIRAQRAAAGYEALYTEAHVADARGKRYYLFLFAAAAGGRVEELFLLSDVEELLPVHQQGLQTILTSLRMGTPALAPPAPAPAPAPGGGGSGGLDGMYRTARLVITGDYNAVSGRMSKKPGYEHWVFFPDGRFYFAYPDAGVQDFDYAALCRRSSQFCGTYSMAGSQGRVTLSDGTAWNVEREGADTIRIKGRPYVRLDPCDGLTLRGTFRRADFRDQYSPKQGITFSPDGRFADEGVAKAAHMLWWSERGGYVDDDGVPGRGTYRITRYSLELKYSDGRFKRMTFNLEPGASRQDVQRFILNAWTFVRVQ